MDLISDLPWENLIEEYVVLRKNSGLTQTDIGSVSSTKQQAVARIENQERTPSLETFMKLLLPLGYTLSITPIDDIKDKETREVMQDYYVKSHNLIVERKSEGLNSNKRLEKYFESLNDGVNKG